jgi:hypothetical protein
MKCTEYNATCKRECSGTCQAKGLYRPSNGTEGMIFTDNFCEQCIHDNPDPNSKKKCEILTATMLFDPFEKQYPREWIYDSDGNPKCTAFVRWDWNNDGDPDDPDNPKAPPPPPDPNQLDLFPLYPNEVEFNPVRKQISA